VATEDLIDFRPALRQQALDNLKNYRWEPSPYVPLILGNINGRRGTINIGNTAGGVNWPGSSFDPETGSPTCRPPTETSRRDRCARRRRDSPTSATCLASTAPSSASPKDRDSAARPTRRA
jgi:hypothetical protein